MITKHHIKFASGCGQYRRSLCPQPGPLNILNKFTNMRAKHRIKHALATALACTLCVTALLAQTAFPDPTPYNLKHFNPYPNPLPPTTSPNLITMQRLVSKGVAYLNTEYFGLYSDLLGAGTGFLIRTDADRDYVCMLTTGHGVNSAATVGDNQFVFFGQVAFNYLRTLNSTDLDSGQEWYNNTAPPNQTNVNVNITYEYRFGAVCPIFISRDPANPPNFGNPDDDYALVGLPRRYLPLGQEIYEMGYDFPTNLSIPSTLDESLFSIHHAKRLPQRVSSVTNAYTAVPGIPDNIVHSVATDLNQWSIGLFYTGGSQGGSSGAPLIQPNNGEPLAIGVLTQGISADNSLANFPGETPTIKNYRLNSGDISDWYVFFQRLSTPELRQAIQEHCTSDETKRKEGRLYTPWPNSLSTANTVINTLGALNDIVKTVSMNGQNYQAGVFGGQVTLRGLQGQALNILSNFVSLHSSKDILVEPEFSFMATEASGLILDHFFSLIGGTQQLAAPPGGLLDVVAMQRTDHAELVWEHRGGGPDDQYVLERSTEGPETGFQPLNMPLPADIDTSSSHLYRDYDLRPASGTNHYRVKVLHPDGTASYSDVKSLVFEDMAAFTVVPNPASTRAALNLEAFLGCGARIELYSQAGVLVQEHPVGQVAERLFELDLSALPAGTYTVWVHSPGHRSVSKKLVVARG